MLAVPDLLDPRDRSPDVQHALRGWLTLLGALGLRPQEACTRVRSAGDPWAVLSQAERQIASARVDPWLRCLAGIGARALPITSPAYPERLSRLPDAAPLLFVLGDPSALQRRSVAVVGPRAPTRSGLNVAETLAGDLARLGLVVVSGLARGIDAAAHRAAIAAGGLTVAVQGCGPDRVYPASHRALAAEIVAAGAVLSEFPPGTPPLKHNFPLRNRLISGLAGVVVVVEARERSGSLVTARLALDQGVDVLVVPGPIDAPNHRGSNRLLRAGAGVCLDADDVLASLGMPPRDVPDHPPALDDLSRRALALLDSLRTEPATRDELGRRFACSPEALALPLLELELAGAVATERDGRLRAQR